MKDTCLLWKWRAFKLRRSLLIIYQLFIKAHQDYDTRIINAGFDLTGIDSRCTRGFRIFRTKSFVIRNLVITKWNIKEKKSIYFYLRTCNHVKYILHEYAYNNYFWTLHEHWVKLISFLYLVLLLSVFFYNWALCNLENFILKVLKKHDHYFNHL